MTDPTQAGQGQQQPSEEEVQQYLEQLRAADVSEIIAQAFNMLATGAQVKLGRPDARQLIDGLAGMVDGSADRLPEQMASQMRDSVSQLQSAQVQAEQEEAGAGAADASGEEDAAAGGQPGPQAQQSPQSDQGSQGGQRATDRLWIPGR